MLSAGVSVSVINWRLVQSESPPSACDGWDWFQHPGDPSAGEAATENGVNALE